MEASGRYPVEGQQSQASSPIRAWIFRKLVLNHTSNEDSKFSYRFIHDGQNKWMSQIDSATRLVVSETIRDPGAASYLRNGLHNPDPKKFWTFLPSRFLQYHFTWIDKAKISLFFCAPNRLPNFHLAGNLKANLPTCRLCVTTPKTQLLMLYLKSRSLRRKCNKRTAHGRIW